MKTLFKILRSIFTSLLFIMLYIELVLQLAFTIVHQSGKELSSLIESEAIYDLVAKNMNSYNIPQFKTVSTKYIDDYMEYVFHKRSYPNIETKNFESFPEEIRRSLFNDFNELREKLDFDYQTILRIRKFNNFLSNGSIYLILNIIVFTSILIISVFLSSFLKGLKLLGLDMIVSSLSMLIIIVVFRNIVLSKSNQLFTILINNILNGEFINSVFNISLLYMIIGTILFILSFLAIKKEINKNLQF